MKQQEIEEVEEYRLNIANEGLHDAKHMVIAKVWFAKGADTKLSTVTKSCDINIGDYIILKKVNEN